jgi:hypothetical protein
MSGGRFLRGIAQVWRKEYEKVARDWQEVRAAWGDWLRIVKRFTRGSCGATCD